MPKPESKPKIASLLAVLLTSTVLLLQGCSPEVGSDAWCTELKEKPKGDWSANDAAGFAEHCILK